MTWKIIKRDLASHVVLIVLVALSLFPFYYMLATSLKSNPQFFSNSLGISFPFDWGNYAAAWAAVEPYVINSAVITVLSVVIIVVTTSVTAYAFARLRFRGKGFLYMAMIALMMIPGALTLIPLFLEIEKFGLLNHRFGLVLVYAAGGQAFTIFVLRQMMANLPEELFESARMDGCSEFKAFLYIALPLTKATIGTLAIMNVMGIWSDYILPLLVLTSPNKMTLTVGLVQFQGEFLANTSYGPMFAGYTIASIPILIMFLLTMRMFMQGITAGAMKF